MSYDVCLFDLDGTIIDPRQGITKSVQHALKLFGIHEETENLLDFIGPPLRESFTLKYNLKGLELENAILRYREYFASKGIFENTLYEGIVEGLVTLKDNGKLLMIATNKPRQYAISIIQNLNLEKYFSFIAGDDMDGGRTKYGKRDVILYAFKHVDVQRKLKSVMIGDRSHDILGAKQTGINSIGISWGYGSKEELLAAEADYIVDTVTELLQLLI